MYKFGSHMFFRTRHRFEPFDHFVKKSRLTGGIGDRGSPLQACKCTFALCLRQHRLLAVLALAPPTAGLFSGRQTHKRRSGAGRSSTFERKKGITLCCNSAWNDFFLRSVLGVKFVPKWWKTKLRGLNLPPQLCFWTQCWSGKLKLDRDLFMIRHEENGFSYRTINCSNRKAINSMHIHIQRATAVFFLYFLTVFSGFLSILIPFLTSCDPHLPCVPHLSVAFYVVKSKASSEQFRRGFAVFSASRFSTTRWTTRKPRRGPPHRGML